MLPANNRVQAFHNIAPVDNQAVVVDTDVIEAPASESVKDDFGVSLKATALCFLLSLPAFFCFLVQYIFLWVPTDDGSAYCDYSLAKRISDCDVLLSRPG